MKKLLVSLIVVVGVVLALGYMLRAQLAVRVVQRVIAQNLAADPLAQFSEGLHVVLCGAGGPLPDPVRSGACVLVVAGQSAFVFDAGSGAARNLGGMRLPPPIVDAVFLTHLHSDHIDGLGELSLLRWTGSGREDHLPVVGPTGVEEVVAGFNRAYRIDAGYRTAHHGEEVAPTATWGMRAQPFPEPADRVATPVWDADGVKIHAFRVEHLPVKPAVGYLVEYAGRTLLISGDTKKSANLEHFAKGVDLLVHEALSMRLVKMMTAAAKQAGRPLIEKITFDILDYHTSPVEVAEIAQAAGVGHLLYYHVVPPLPVPGLDVVFLEGTSDAYSGGITLGVDGTMVSLPKGSSAIEVSKR